MKEGEPGVPEKDLYGLVISEEPHLPWPVRTRGNRSSSQRTSRPRA